MLVDRGRLDQLQDGLRRLLDAILADCLATAGGGVADAYAGRLTDLSQRLDGLEAMAQLEIIERMAAELAQKRAH